MIIADKKKAISTILARHTNGGMEAHQEVAPEQGLNDHEQTKINIGNDMLHAIKINSGKAMAQALEAFFDLMESSEHESVEQED